MESQETRKANHTSHEYLKDLIIWGDCLLGYRLIWLCISYISDDVQEAYNLIKDLEPTTPQVIDRVLHFY